MKIPDFITSQVREFLTAAFHPQSYNVFKNIYIWFGFLWGIPIPIVTIFMHLHFLDMHQEPHPFIAVISSPFQWVFILHPVLFGIIFGILGTIKYEKERQLNTLLERFRTLSSKDPLTGLNNRRYFAHNFHDECARSYRRREPLTLLFMDLDHFKNVNDQHGHHMGDTVLKETAAFLKSQCRPYDIPVRWGGEEFIILLRGSNETAAILFAERIRLGIESGTIYSVDFPITISIGLAQYQENDSLESLVDRADQALYHAKQTGRNRVISWSTLQSAIRT